VSGTRGEYGLLFGAFEMRALRAGPLFSLPPATRFARMDLCRMNFGS